MMHPSEMPRLVVAVDFGTIYTSVAWAYSEDSENFEFIEDWPGCWNRRSTKVPTEILYLDTLSGDGQRQYQWGYGVNPGRLGNAEPLRGFKLLLDDRNAFVRCGNYGSSLTERVTSNTPVTATQPTQLGLSLVEVTTDYLRSVREHTIALLRRRFIAEFVNKTRIQYILTVPAVCSNLAMARTLEAARNAGFGEYEIDFNLIAEPAAAATYTLKVIQPKTLEEGDTFVICDAGEETVDLISYKIKTLDPLSISEVGSGSGCLCGSGYVNDKFKQHVRNLLGDSTFNRMKPIAKREMIKQWEKNVKFKFAESKEIEYYEVCIPGVPDNEEIGLEKGFLSLSRSIVKRIFDPAIDRIVELVDEKIRNVGKEGENVSAILLFGSFGASEYLHKRLREHTFFGGKVEVIQPKNASSAITVGALIQGLNGISNKDHVVQSHYKPNVCGG